MGVGRIQIRSLQPRHCARGPFLPEPYRIQKRSHHSRNFWRIYRNYPRGVVFRICCRLLSGSPAGRDPRRLPVAEGRSSGVVDRLSNRSFRDADRNGHRIHPLCERTNPIHTSGKREGTLALAAAVGRRDHAIDSLWHLNFRVGRSYCKGLWECRLGISDSLHYPDFDIGNLQTG